LNLNPSCPNVFLLRPKVKRLGLSTWSFLSTPTTTLSDGIDDVAAVVVSTSVVSSDCSVTVLKHKMLLYADYNNKELIINSNTEVTVNNTSLDCCQLQGTPCTLLLDFVSPEARSHTGLRGFQPKFGVYFRHDKTKVLGTKPEPSIDH
jgi:hypothetical protein